MEAKGVDLAKGFIELPQSRLAGDDGGVPGLDLGFVSPEFLEESLDGGLLIGGDGYAFYEGIPSKRPSSISAWERTHSRAWGLLISW